ncbi:MAG: nucleotidyltransferase domain-containing protein [Anaerolineales bacterium]|nr:nucleotidyltransferase domain-containing protein [Anaerolineales bacterium]MDP3186124.1 nucleotidyltransferase domain-containing protein [Anaerolineales bacterium]
MANKTVIKSIQKYLHYLTQQGIPVSYGVLYGSYAKGKAHKWSDIDLLVVSPKYDRKRTTDDYESLWIFAGRTDSRIEPIPVGEKQYEADESSMIIEIARREGQIIPLAE